MALVRLRALMGLLAAVGIATSFVAPVQASPLGRIAARWFVEPDSAQPLLQDPEAQQHLQRGLDYFYAEDFRAASLEFKAAYAIEPKPFLLYSWAQAERYVDNCERAVDLFNRFLASDPPKEEAAKARERVLECGGTPVAPDPAPVSVPVPEPESEPDPESAPRPSNRLEIVLGATSVTLGAGLVGGGAVLVIDGKRRADALGDLRSHQGFVDALQQSESRRTLGWSMVGVGSAFVVTGVVVLSVYLARRAGRSKDAAWVPGLGPSVRF